MEIPTGQVSALLRRSPEKKKSGMGTDCADDSAEGEDDDDDEETPVPWPFYGQLLFLRDTMTTRQ